MWSGIKRLSLAWRLTLSNAVVFLLVLLGSSLAILAGLYYSILQQAERDMQRAVSNMRQTVEAPDPELLQEFQRLTAKLWLSEKNIELRPQDIMDGPRGMPLFPLMMVRQGNMPSGIIMRVVRNHDRMLVYDTSPAFPKIQVVERNILEGHPFWGSYDYKIAGLNDNVRVFFTRELIDWGQVSYTVYFMSVITVDHQFMRSLGIGLLMLNLCAILLALFCCHGLTRHTLEPLEHMQEEMQEIEVGKLQNRVSLPADENEIHALALSVNGMLGRLEAGVAREQRFVSDASHELRTPLAIILGHAGLLRRWGKDDKATLDEGLETIYNEADSMSQLVQRLLELARADMKRLKLKPEILDAGELLERLYREMLPVTTRHELVLGLHENGFVQADPSSLEELLLILLENAVKYTPEGGTITLFSRRENNEMHLGVRDTGVGIAAEDLPHIFERFYRVDSARTRQTGGTGLGLALAEQLVLANGGRVTVESEPGKGTCLHVYLPLMVLE